MELNLLITYLNLYLYIFHQVSKEILNIYITKLYILIIAFLLEDNHYPVA